jgi:Tol biopolymer transport system component
VAIAYVRVLGEEQALYLRQTTGDGDVQVLAPALGNFVAVTFSPDGNSLYFVRADPKDMGFRYLFQIPTLGGYPRKLVTDVDSGVAFSPDGHLISYQRWFAHRDEGELNIANADGSAERSLVRISKLDHQSAGDPAPDWSPDGRIIVLSKLLLEKPRRWVIYAVSVENGSIRELYSTFNWIGRPIWLPSGNGLLIPQYDPIYHRSQLWTISYPQGAAHRFTHDISDYSTDVDSTSDGRTVVSIASAVQSHIWRSSSAEHSDAQQITSGEHPFFLSKLTPDEKILSTDAYGSLWTMNLDGTQAMAFGNLHDVGWFALCGNYVVALSHENSSTALVRMDMNGSQVKTLATGILWSPSCAGEADTVYYMNFDMPQKTWRVPLEGGAPTEVAPIEGDTIMGNLSVSPDGKFLAYQSNSWSASSPSRHVTVIPANGGSPVASLDTKGENWMVGPYWTPDSKAIQYLRVENQISNIWEQPLAGGSPKKLTHFTSGHIADFAWSADRSRLFLTRDIETTDVVLLTNSH